MGLLGDFFDAFFGVGIGPSDEGPSPTESESETKSCSECGKSAYQICSYCGKPVCSECLVSYEIRSQTHDGWIHHHKSCDSKSSARNFEV